jgi:signal transduction histidine kinase
VEQGIYFSSLVDKDSIQKYLNFLFALKEEKALYDWEINIHSDSSVFSLYFVGSLIEDNLLLIVASDSRNDAGYFYDEIMRMNNEQTDMLRLSMKERAHQREYPEQQSISPEEQNLYWELSKLNNELTNVQRDLQKKNVQLQNLIEIRNRFIGMAAHDLRNPISGIFSMCQILSEDQLGPLTEEQKEYINTMKETAGHILELVNQMLEITKIESGKIDLQYQQTNIIDLIAKAVAFNKPKASKKEIPISFDPPEKELPIVVDRRKMYQVLDNLISNAIKYSNKGKPITLTVEPYPEYVRISVIDRGKGIPEKEMGQLFTPFAKLSVTSTAGEYSTGLGLAICKQIVEAHKGAIGAESTPGVGSKFYFTIPWEPST